MDAVYLTPEFTTTRLHCLLLHTRTPVRMPSRYFLGPFLAPPFAQTVSTSMVSLFPTWFCSQEDHSAGRPLQHDVFFMKMYGRNFSWALASGKTVLLFCLQLAFFENVFPHYGQFASYNYVLIYPCFGCWEAQSYNL